MSVAVTLTKPRILRIGLLLLRVASSGRDPSTTESPTQAAAVVPTRRSSSQDTSQACRRSGIELRARIEQRFPKTALALEPGDLPDERVMRKGGAKSALR